MSFFRIHLDSMSIRWSGCVYRTFQSDKGAKWGAIYFHNDYFNRYIVITWACVYSSFYCCTYKRNYVCMYRPDFPDTKKPKGTNFKFSWLFKIMMLGLTSKNSSKNKFIDLKRKKKGQFHLWTHFLKGEPTEKNKKQITQRTCRLKNKMYNEVLTDSERHNNMGTQNSVQYITLMTSTHTTDGGWRGKPKICVSFCWKVPHRKENQRVKTFPDFATNRRWWLTVQTPSSTIFLI